MTLEQVIADALDAHHKMRSECTCGFVYAAEKFNGTLHAKHLRESVAAAIRAWALDDAQVDLASRHMLAHDARERQKRRAMPPPAIDAQHARARAALRALFGEEE